MAHAPTDTAERPAPPVRLRFGAYVLDEVERALYCGGERLHVEPKVLDLLAHLARRWPELVPFDEIQSAHWPDVSVTADARNRVISQARQAVGDSGTRQDVIETVRGRGLRFVPPVERLRPREIGVARLARRPAIGDDGPFVGREVVMATLETELRSAACGRGGVVVLEGEAGVGKTRVAHELGAAAREQRAAVHWGRCALDRGETGPYFVWRQILASVLQETTFAEAPPSLAAAIHDLGVLLPELAAGRVLRSPPVIVDTVQARARLLEAVPRLLAAAAQEAPRLLILDDLQWADPDSLKLTCFLASALRDLRVLLLVTWRSDEQPSPELAAARAHLARAKRNEIHLRGLRRREVAEILERAAEVRPNQALVASLHQKSDGNAFFVVEMARLLLDRVREDDAHLADVVDVEIPASLSHVLAERLAGLSPEHRSLLELAAVIGREVEVEVWSRAAGRSEADVIACSDAAGHLGLVSRHPSRPDVVRFSHWLLVSHLNEVSEPTHPEHAWAVAGALEALYGDRAERWSEIAHQRCRGVAAGDPAVAAAAARRAAGHAAALLAHEEAASHLAAALRMLTRVPDTPSRERAELLLDLGRAQLRAGRREEAVRSFDEAAAIARRSNLTDVLARAALGYSGLPATLAGDHKAQLERVLEALGRLDERDLSLRARLLSRQAAIRGVQGDHAAAEGLAQQAVELARRVEDPATVASTLRARNVVLVADVLRSDERLAHAAESLAYAERAGDRALALDSRLHRAVALLHRGDAARFRHEMAQYRTQARELRHPAMEFLAALAEVTGLALDGRFEAAEKCAHLARQCGQRAEHPDTDVYFGIQIAQLRYFQGRLDEVVEPLEAASAGSGLAGLRAALALAYADTGRRREAAGLLHLLIEDFAAAARDSGWLSNVSLLSLVASRLRDPAAAERLTPLLEPYAHCTVSAFLVSCNGSAAYFLGLLAQARDRHAEAGVHLNAARKANEEMGAVPWLLHTDVAMAGSLTATRRERDRTRALRIARRVARDAAAYGMPVQETEASALIARLTADGGAVDPSEG